MSEKQELKVFDALTADITALIEPTRSIKVASLQQANAACEAAKQVRELRNRIEKTRHTLVDPLNQRVREINAYAKQIEAPLVEVETSLKGKLTAFEIEQEKKREEERRRLEEEKRRAEEELRRRQEEERTLAESASEVNDLFGSDDDAPSVPSVEEVAEKHAQEQAVLKIEQKAKEFDIDQKGVKNTRKVWRCELVDAALVPKELLIMTLNERAVLAMARSGVTKIAGVKLWQETTVAIGRNTYVPRVSWKGNA